MIDVYNDGRAQEMKYLIRTIPARIRMEGFIYTDQFIECMEEFYANMGGLIASGAVTMRETVHDGIETAPDALLGLFSGANMGKMLIRVRSEERRVGKESSRPSRARWSRDH